MLKKIKKTKSGLDYLKKFADVLEEHPAEQMTEDLIKIAQSHTDAHQ